VSRLALKIDARSQSRVSRDSPELDTKPPSQECHPASYDRQIQPVDKFARRFRHASDIQNAGGEIQREQEAETQSLDQGHVVAPQNEEGVDRPF
jgi:hypothetical protein